MVDAGEALADLERPAVRDAAADFVEEVDDVLLTAQNARGDVGRSRSINGELRRPTALDYHQSYECSRVDAHDEAEDAAVGGGLKI